MIESLLLEETIDTNLPPLQFPNDDFWNVFITVANSTLEVWLRIIGVEYSVSFYIRCTYLTVIDIDVIVFINLYR